MGEGLRAQRLGHRGGTIADGAAGGGDQSAITDETMIEAPIDLKLALHPRLLEARGEAGARVAHTIEAADGPMWPGWAGPVRRRRGGGPVLLLLPPFPVGPPE